MLRSKKGFTLTELLIVIAIICIVALVAIPIVTGVMNKTTDHSDEVTASLYTSVMQRFSNEAVGDAMLYPSLTTTGADSEYGTLFEKGGKGSFPGYNIIKKDSDSDEYDAIRREAVIAIKAFTDVSTLDGYYVAQPNREGYQFVYYYLTGEVKLEKETDMVPVTQTSISNGVVDTEDYWVYLSRDGGSGEAISNAENGKGMVFIQIRQFGTDALLSDARVTLRIGSEIKIATTGSSGTVGFSNISLGSVFAEAEKLGAISFPNSSFYTNTGEITVKNGGYIGDSAANPYVITLKMGTLGSLGFYRQHRTWEGGGWITSESYITDNVNITSSFSVDTTRNVATARAETYYTNAQSSGGKQELLTADGKYLLYGPYNMTIFASGFRSYSEAVQSKVYGIDNYKNGGLGEHSGATEPYEYPIIMRLPQGQGVLNGVISYERAQQPLAGSVTYSGSWLPGSQNYTVRTRVKLVNTATGASYYSAYFTANSSGQHPYSITGLPDGRYKLNLDTPYGDSNSLNMTVNMPSYIDIDGTDITVNGKVYLSDVGTGSSSIEITYDYRGNYDPISGATVSYTRLGIDGVKSAVTDDDGKCSFTDMKRGFYTVRVTLPSYIGSTTYAYKQFIDGNESVVIRLPIAAFSLSGSVSGIKANDEAMDRSGTFSGLKVTFTRYNKNGTRSYSSKTATVGDSGVTATYSISIVPGNYKITTETTCYQAYSGQNTLFTFKTNGTHSFSLKINGVNITCHPTAKVVWKQDATYHWQECEKCGNQFYKEKHDPSPWTASGADGCYRYCTEPNCKRILDSVTAHAYVYQTVGSYSSTCVRNGNSHYTCSRCSYAKDVSIPLTGHNYGDWISDGDETHTKYCRNSGCGSSVTNNHSFGEWYWISHEIEMSPTGSYCYSSGTQRSDCLYCSYYKLNKPKVGHSIDCYMMREYVSSSVYYNMPTNYSSAYFLTPSGRLYARLQDNTQYGGRRIYLPANPDNGGYGHTEFFRMGNASESLYSKSAIFSYQSHSHIVACKNTPVIGGVTHYCYAPINHNGDPHRTSNACGCRNSPLGYVVTPGGWEIIPHLNPAWEDPYYKNGRR